MAKYKLTNKAVDDLTNIWYYTLGKWSEKQADKYYNMLIDNFNEISKKPSLGKYYSDVFKNILGFRAGRHVIYYREIQNNEIEIIRILHEHMDLKNGITEQ